MNLATYLSFNGNCKEAFELYASVLGGEIVSIRPYAGTPAEGSVPPEWREKIINARLIVKGQMLMGSDMPAGHYEEAHGYSVAIDVDTVAEAERIFGVLSQGAKVSMPLSETFWAERFGMLTDRFGTPWMVNCERKQ